MVKIGVPSPKVLIIAPTFNLEIDASVSETHDRKAEVTQFPVETGSVFTDHVVYQPIELQMQGIVSNTVLAFFTAVPTPSVPGGDPTSRGEDAFAALEGVMRDGIRCGIITTLSQYENMVLMSLSTPRDAGRGNMAELNMHWRQITLAETEAVETPQPVEAQQAPTTGAGKQQAGPVDSQTEKRNKSSLWWNLANGS